MALLKCPECGHQVSTSASSCPNCGFPVSRMNKSNSIPEVEQSSATNTSFDESWVEEIKHKAKKSRNVLIIIMLSILVLAIVFTLIGTLLKVGLFYALIPMMWFIFIVFFIIGLVSVFSTKVYVEHRNNNVIAVYKGINKPKAFINNKEMEYENRKVGNGYAEYKFKLPDGDIMIATVQSHKITLDFYSTSPSTIQNQTIVNNYITNKTINKKKGSNNRSDMEKILIKNAKVDALASIDPTNTKKSKEQLDIINQLDELDD